MSEALPLPPTQFKLRMGLPTVYQPVHNYTPAQPRSRQVLSKLVACCIMLALAFTHSPFELGDAAWTLKRAFQRLPSDPSARALALLYDSPIIGELAVLQR